MDVTARSTHCAGRMPLPVAALLLGLAVLANLPHIVFHRAAPSFDFMVHYRWAVDVAEAMAAGDPWPHWMPHAAWGLGEPALLYYAPAYYLAVGLVRPLVANSWVAMHVVEVGASLAGGWFAWALAAVYVGRRRAWPAGVLGVLSPMAIMLNQGFNGFPWAVAMAPIGWLFWAMLRPGAHGRPLNAPAMLALAMTICTHTLSGLMAMMCLAPLAFLGADGRLRLDARQIVAVGAVFAGGLLLSAAYLWPALAYKPLIDQGVFTQKFTPWSAFVLPTFTRAFGMHWWALQVPIPLAAFGAGGLGAWALQRRGASDSDRRLGAAGLLVLGVAAFFALELSYPLWRLETPLRYLQFPFRMTTIAAVAMPVLVTVALARVGAGTVRWGLIGSGGAATLLAVALLGQQSTQGRRPDLSRDSIAPYNGLPEYRLATRGADWKAYADGGLLAGECRRLGIVCAAKGRDGAGREGAGFRWRIVALRPVSVRLPLFDFPALAVAVDGEERGHARDGATGLIAVVLAPGAHDVFVRWRPLPIQRHGMWVSLAALAAILAMLALGGRRAAGAAA